MFDDLKLAWKRLRNAPGFTTVAVVTLALAVGANAAIFTVADAVLFRPLPYSDADRLFVVRSIDPATGFRSSRVPYEYVAAIQRHHSGVAAAALRSATIMMTHVGAEGAESIETFYAAPDYFQILGVPPVLGRLFNPADVPEGASRAVLTYESWRTRFGADEAIIGRKVMLGSADRTVVGVLPRGFIFPAASLFYSDATTGRAEFVAVAEPPVPADPGKPSGLIYRGMASDAIIRLAAGVTRDQAQAELDVLVSSVRPPQQTEAGHRIVLDDLRALLFPTGRRILVLLLAAAGLVLLLGCANLSNMLLARTQRREREIAVQAALGASSVRLMRPVLFETLIIGAAASAVAICITVLMSDALIREVPPVAYGRAFIGVDLRVAAFSFVLGTAAGLLFAVVPAWRSSRMDVRALVRSGTARARRPGGLGRPMIAVQVALAIVLASGAVTAARQFVVVLNQPVGFDPQELIGVRVQSQLEGVALRDFQRRVTDALTSHGDVVAAGAGSSRPFDRFGGAEGVSVGTGRLPVAHVLPGYLETLRVRLHEGRLPESESSPTGLEPAVLTQSAARRLFPGRHAVGETIPLEGRMTEVVGVVDDVVTDFENVRAWVFIVPRDPGRLSTILVRTRARSPAILADIRRQIVALSPPTAPVTARWVEDSLGAQSGYRNPRFQSIVLGLFAALALGLAALGIFAMVAAAVAARSREMGVRIAVGASPPMVVRLVVGETLVAVGSGVVIGIAAARSLGRIAQAQVADVAAAPLEALGVAVAVVVTAGLLAAYLPARRASRVDPVVVLRAD